MFILIIIIIVFNYVLELIKEILNVKNISTELPREFKDIYSREKYEKSQSYLRDNTCFDLISGAFFLAITLVFIFLNGFNSLDLLVRNLGLGQIFTGLLYIGILVTGIQILNLPFSYYRVFVIEEKYGFNRQTLKTFILDIIKAVILSCILGFVIIYAILFFFEKTGPNAWLYCWAFTFVYQLLIYFIAPVLIMPLFNKFIPLEDGELKEKIRNYADLQKFRLSGIFKMDGSRRSGKSNAFFTGIGRYRRIVLFDTLIESHTADELVSVLAHEIGHYKKKHILKNLIMSVISTGFLFYLMSLVIGRDFLFDAFSMKYRSVYAGLIFFFIIYSPLSTVMSLVSNIFSRRHEYEADNFAVRTTENAEVFINALKRLSVDNLSNLNPHKFKVIMDYSHPPVLERIKRIRGPVS